MVSNPRIVLGFPCREFDSEPEQLALLYHRQYLSRRTASLFYRCIAAYLARSSQSLTWCSILELPDSMNALSYPQPFAQSIPLHTVTQIVFRLHYRPRQPHTVPSATLPGTSLRLVNWCIMTWIVSSFPQNLSYALQLARTADASPEPLCFTTQRISKSTVWAAPRAGAVPRMKITDFCTSHRPLPPCFFSCTFLYTFSVGLISVRFFFCLHTYSARVNR